MVQVFDYYENNKLIFNDIESLCDTLNLKRKNVIKAISRETKVLKRYLISYGLLDDQLIFDKKPNKYRITDLHTEETLSFECFVDLVNYANKILNANYPISSYHRNMARNCNSYKRFFITKE